MPVRLDPARMGEALAFAVEHHGDQRRKGTDVPYVSHLLAVASLVLDDGGDETEAIAALLHDVVEDCPDVTVEVVRDAFGPDVAAIVEACSDRTTDPKPPWPERKDHYVQHLLDPATSVSALRVSAADKVHNLQSMLDDHRRIGDDLWQRFNEAARSAEAQLGNYRRLLEAFEARLPDSTLTAKLRRTYDELAARVAHVDGGVGPVAAP